LLATSTLLNLLVLRTRSRCAMEDLSQGKPFYEESIDEPN